MASVTYNEPTVDYAECTMPKSPIESHDGQRFKATRILKCAWADRLTLERQLRRAYSVDSSGRTFIFGDPYPHRSRTYVRRVTKIEGQGGPGGSDARTAKWDDALLTVEYEEQQFNPEGGSSSSETPEQLFDEEYDFESQTILRPGDASLFWADGTEVSDIDAPAARQSIMRWRVSFQEDGNPPNAIYNAIDKVNSDAIVSSTYGFSFDAETLLYLGPQIRRAVFSDGSVQSEVTLNFAYKRNGTWNQFFKPGNVSPQAVYTDTSGSSQWKPAESTSFVSAFQLATS